MNKQKKHVRFWVITDEGEEIPFYTLRDYMSKPSQKVSHFIISNYEINNTMKRNRILFNSMGKIYHSKTK